MKKSLASTGFFVVFAVVVFTAGLFLIGDKHNAFNRHVNFYASLANIEGIGPGAKVRVSGFEGGQVTKIIVPGRPSEKFRVELRIEDKLRALIRSDSLVSVETDGLVGDKFLLIHSGTDKAAQAEAGSTLMSKEPIELSAVIEKVTGTIDLANATINDVTKRVDVTLDTLNGTINNANGLVTGVRNGRGTVGMLLSDERTSQEVRTAVVNARQATTNLDQVTDRANQLMADLQSKNLPQKADDAIVSAKSATYQLNQASTQLNASLSEALGPDRSGTTAGRNISDALSNANQATVNLTDDSEALKHGFLFRGFFKKRGFYTLADLSPEQYRTTPFFAKTNHQRSWLDASDALTTDSSGKEILSAKGERALNTMIAAARESIPGAAIIIEGYANRVAPEDQLATSKSRALLVERYLESHFELDAKNLGIIALNATPPPATGKSTWDGVCIVVLASAKK